LKFSSCLSGAQEKACAPQAFLDLRTFLRLCGKKDFEQNPVFQSGQPLLVPESPDMQAFSRWQGLASLNMGIGFFKSYFQHQHRRG